MSGRFAPRPAPGCARRLRPARWSQASVRPGGFVGYCARRSVAVADRQVGLCL